MKLVVVVLIVARAHGLISSGASRFREKVRSQRAHWMDAALKFDSSPKFDVLERTKEYIKATETATANKEYQLSVEEEFFASDYVFRGSIIGPINAHDVAETQKSFNIIEAFPDLDRGIFGFQIDPQNPYRIFFFERWTATMTGPVSIGPITIEPNHKRVENPIHVTSITWNPDAKMIYQSISSPIDRFEGNTRGSGAILGLLSAAGLGGTANIGDPFLILQQKLITRFFSKNIGKNWSSDADIPSWWKSKARGAESNDI